MELPLWTLIPAFLLGSLFIFIVYQGRVLPMSLNYLAVSNLLWCGFVGIFYLSWSGYDKLMEKKDGRNN